MAFEKRDATQFVSLAPPLPIRAFPITGVGSTTEASLWGGSGTDGVRYGVFAVNTAQWANAEGQHLPPMTVGEQFMIYAPTGSGNFPSMGSFGKTTSAADLFDVGDMAIELADDNIMTVIGTEQLSTNSWNVFYGPFEANIADIVQGPNVWGIVTVPKPYQPRWFGRMGHVASVDYIFAVPGGPDQLTFDLQCEPNFRDPGLNPGRIIQGFRGGECIWEGQLTEPTPSATGWSLTCNGVGTYGSNFGAYYSKWNSDDAVNKAITRGMRWLNPGIGSPSGIYLGPEQDSGSLLITDFLNLLCTGGALQWMLVPSAGSSAVPAPPWTLQVRPMPTDQNGSPLVLGAADTAKFSIQDWHRTDTLTAQKRQPPDLYLVNINPIGRTIQDDYNTIILKYQVSADNVASSTTAAETAIYAQVVVDVPSSVQIHGRMEYYLDITNAGTMTAAKAASIGQNVLNQYIRANFTSGFTVQPGQLLNSGGVPVDLGCNWAGKVCTVQNINMPDGGEVTFGPLTFLIGTYEYNDDSQTATVTPYQAAATDISSVIAQLYPGAFA